MTRQDDSNIDALQLFSVKKHADRLLREASAIGRFPTPIDDLMAAAKLTVVADEELNESFLRQFMMRAKAGVAAVKSALSKVLGLFDSQERLVIIERQTPKPRIPFIKLHEAGHGWLPHQSKLYRIMQDCEKTLDADIKDLFEREANVFASEVLFQGTLFSNQAHGQSFGIKVPMDLAQKFGASNYASFRRYASTSPEACCVIVLEPATLGPDGSYLAEVRRVVMSQTFALIYDDKRLCADVSESHPLMPVIPRHGKQRMTLGGEIVLCDLNGDERVCLAEAFKTKHNTFILLFDTGKRLGKSILMPASLLTATTKMLG